MNTFKVFESVDDETRGMGLRIIHDTALQDKLFDTLNLEQEAANDNGNIPRSHFLVSCINDISMQELLYLWIECDRDLVLTKLSYDHVG